MMPGPKPKPRGGLITRMRRLAEEFYSLTQVAEMLGEKRSVLSGIAQRRGITFYGRGGAPYGNTNRTGRYKGGRTADQRREDRKASQRARTAQYRRRRRLAAEQVGD